MEKITYNRFGVTGWLFILGLTISAFVLMNISDVVDRIRKEEVGINKFSYSEIYRIKPVDYESFYQHTSELAPGIISAALSSDCNTSFYDLSVNAEHQIDYSFVELVMNSPHDQKLVSDNGEPIDVNFPKDSNAILIGESMVPITENGEGKFLNLNNIIVPVADILKNYSPSKIDNSIYAFWDSVDDDFRKYLTSRIIERLSELTLQIRFYDDSPISDDVSRFSDEMEDLGLWCEPAGTYLGLGYNGKDAENLWYRAYNIVLLPVCVVFAVFTCFTASYLWLLSRTKELSIRKAYGYTNAQILALVIKDEFLLAIPSAAAALVIQFLLCLLTNSIDFFDILFIPKFAFVCAGLILIAVLCALRQIKSLSRISPAEAVKND